MIQWQGDNFLKLTEEELGKNIEKAAIYLKGKIKDNINTAQPRRRYKGQHGIYYKGLDPSKPGDAFPKRVVGDLVRSIAYEMGDQTTAYVGSALPYAAYLEFGTRHMVARPFFSATLFIEATALQSIIGTGKAT